jgi:hypothetical protein
MKSGHHELPACIKLLLFVGIGLLANQAHAQKRVISLEIAASDRAELTTQQQWMEMLSGVGADRVRSRTARGLVEPKVEEVQLGGTVSITVIGVISGRELILPGEKFGIRDAPGIRDYIQKLRDDGSKVALADKKAFGLTSEQLVGVSQELSAVVNQSTKGEKTGNVVEQIVAQLKTPVEMDSMAREALAGSSTVKEELKGLSTGTALAAAIRPLGLVLAPVREQGKSLKIQIVDSRSVEESWPIGWPIEKPVDQIEPKLFDNLENIEIRGFALNSILDRLEQRLGIPFIYDQNTMAREGIDLEATKVTLVKERTAYMLAISKLLAQTRPRMKQEVRVDENGKPFLWISIPH